MSTFRKTEISLILFAGICLLSFAYSSATAQQSDNSAGNLKDTVDVRIKRQRMRVNDAVKQGAVSKQQAMQLKNGLDQLQARVNTQRQVNGGKLKPEQLVQAENSLNQNNDIIKSFSAAGTKVVDNGKVLGPSWSAGKDGAQNSLNLQRQMKEESRREHRQYRQAMEQQLEQQQLDYEKQTIQNFKTQRDDILKQKEQLKQVRKESGAD